MKPRKLARSFLWILASLAILMVFVVLDWYPTVKELGRLRRERGDIERKVKNYSVMASSFVFPDPEENSLLARTSAELRRVLLQVDEDDAWPAMALLELQAQVRAERIANARVFFTFQALGTELGTAGPGRSAALADWLSLQVWDLRESFSITDQNRYPWHAVFSGSEFIRQQRLASRPLVVALAAPLPALLDFINHISWGETRLEIVRLHLEPGAALPRAWLICRGNYLVRKPSAWAVKEDSGTAGDNLLVDPDSPLLWQKVVPQAVVPAMKNELPPMRDTGLFIRKKN